MDIYGAKKLDNLKSRYIFALSNEIRSTCTFGIFTRNVLLDDVQTENGKPQGWKLGLISSTLSCAPRQ